MIITTSHHLASSSLAALPQFERCDASSLHLFRTDHASDEAIARVATVLSPDERERAARFHFERDRHTYVLARAALRQLLAAQLDLQPEQLAFDYNRFGKPLLAAAPQLHFNVSHSGGLAAVALCPHGKVGIDIERVTPERAALEAAERFFAPNEWRALQACAPAIRHELFFALWTLKEAYVKAKDQGLSIGLDSFEFDVGDEGPVQFASTLGDRAADWQFPTGIAFETHRWSLAIEAPATLAPRLHVLHYE